MRRQKAVKLLPLIFGIILFGISGVPSVYARELVLLGIPFSQDDSTAERISKKTLNDQEQKENQLVITRDGDRYYWESFEDKPLVYTKRQDFIYFIEPDGGGFIKVYKDPSGVVYMERRSSKTSNMTFMGKSASIEI